MCIWRLCDLWFLWIHLICGYDFYVSHDNIKQILNAHKNTNKYHKNFNWDWWWYGLIVGDCECQKHENNGVGNVYNLPKPNILPIKPTILAAYYLDIIHLYPL